MSFFFAFRFSHLLRQCRRLPDATIQTLARRCYCSTATQNIRANCDVPNADNSHAAQIHFVLRMENTVQNN